MAWQGCSWDCCLGACASGPAQGCAWQLWPCFGKKLLFLTPDSLSAGELFAQAPIDQYPGIAVETVADSSRYFVIRIQDGTGEQRDHLCAACCGWRRQPDGAGFMPGGLIRCLEC